MNEETKNLLQEALRFESYTKNKYEFYAQKAKEEGYAEIENVFRLTAKNEEEHAKLWFNKLGLLNTTLDNLDEAINKEEHEFYNVYKTLSEKALQLGEVELSKEFSMVGKIEHQHATTLRKFYDDLYKNQTFKKDKITHWICTKCGYETKSKTAPGVCPVCKESLEYFSVKKVDKE